uniref:Ig-like domain-containing protein n=1 Tax=Oryzias latipes TaxID=8090 RepID=A0A3P9HH67_ORYLA
PFLRPGWRAWWPGGRLFPACSRVLPRFLTNFRSYCVLFLFTSTEGQPKSGFSNKESVQKEVKATLSKTATLTCEVADAKTEVKWFKEGKLVTSSKTVHAESKGKMRQLVIDSVEKKDAGEYSCEAGTEKMTFKIHLDGKEML